MTLIWRTLTVGVILLAGLLTHAFVTARADPVVRRATIALPDWPTGAKPVTIVLISDIHIGTAAMDAARLDRIVGRINALRPDLVVIAGDFIFGHDPGGAARLGDAMVAPLSHLRAPLGVVAVPGNHDHWTGLSAVREQLTRAGILVLDNQAVMRGPIALGGVGDDFSGHSDIARTLDSVRRLPGAHVLLTHSPDIAPALPADMPLLLAGHTHCGQVVVPFYGPLSDVSRYRERYRCGVRHEAGRVVVTTAGLGTSGGPFRIGAAPDLWLLTVGPVPH